MEASNSKKVARQLNAAQLGWLWRSLVKRSLNATQLR